MKQRGYPGCLGYVGDEILPSYMGITWITLQETNIFAPEKWWLEDYFPFGMAYFQG